MESFAVLGESRPSSSPASEAILAEIERVDGTDAMDFDPVLASVIDPEALDRIVSADSFDGTVEFTYMGYDVVVDGNGHVSVSAAV